MSAVLRNIAAATAINKLPKKALRTIAFSNIWSHPKP